MPRSIAASATSIITALSPLVAQACAMPFPMVPAPITPTFLIAVIEEFPLVGEAAILPGCVRARPANGSSAPCDARAARRLLAQSREKHVDHPRRCALQVVRIGSLHPFVHHADHERIHAARREPRIG